MFKIDQTKLNELNVQREREWRDSELIRADIQINKLEDVGSDALSWRGYRQALRDWPAHEHFPQKEYRPKAPA